MKTFKFITFLTGLALAFAIGTSSIVYGAAAPAQKRARAAAPAAAAEPAEDPVEADFNLFKTVDFNRWKIALEKHDQQALFALLHVINLFVIKKNQALQQQSLWVNNYAFVQQTIADLAKIEFKTTNDIPQDPLLLFTTKLLLPDDASVTIIGDIHGNFNTLNSIILNMIANGLMDEKLILKPNVYFIGLGDYVDRGDKSLETFATLCLIALKNPTQTILLRGNHEEIILNIAKYTLLDEIKSFDDSNKYLSTTIHTLFKAYELLPSALYLGKDQRTQPASKKTNFLLLSHGGIELRYNANFLLAHPIPADSQILFDLITDTNVLTKDAIKNQQLKTMLVAPTCNDYYSNSTKAYGFYWNDILKPFSLDITIAQSSRGKGILDLSFFALKAFLENFNTDSYEISGMIGGHDHTLAKDRQQQQYPDASPDAIMTQATPSTIMFAMVEDQLSSALLQKDQLNTKKFSFTYTKIISGPIKSQAPYQDIVYPPTILTINWDNAQDAWLFKSTWYDESRTTTSAAPATSAGAAGAGAGMADAAGAQAK